MPLVSAQQQCVHGPGTCVVNAECVSGLCECVERFYPENGACLRVKDAGRSCDMPGQCTAHAECVAGSCVCDPGYYEKVSVFLKLYSALCVSNCVIFQPTPNSQRNESYKSKLSKFLDTYHYVLGTQH